MSTEYYFNFYQNNYATVGNVKSRPIHYAQDIKEIYT